MLDVRFKFNIGSSILIYYTKIECLFKNVRFCKIKFMKPVIQNYRVNRELAAIPEYVLAQLRKTIFISFVQKNLLLST